MADEYTHEPATTTLLPTAQALGRFKRELEAEGFSGDIVNDLVDIAARELIPVAGLVVKEVGRDG